MPGTRGKGLLKAVRKDGGKVLKNCGKVLKSPFRYLAGDSDDGKRPRRKVIRDDKSGWTI